MSKVKRAIKNRAERALGKIPPLKLGLLALVLAAIGLFLFRQEIIGLVGQRIESAGTKFSTPQPEVMSDTSDEKAIKSTCVDEVRDYIESIKGKKITKVEFTWLVNSKYRFCLAENGLTPEDLLSVPTSSQGTYQEPKLETSAQEKIRKSFEESEKRQQQKCQQDWVEYNTCLSEYNAEVSEYNLCMSSPRMPTNKVFCGHEPSNSCFKPFCRL